MMRDANLVAVREREREPYFNEPRYGFVQQPDTHTQVNLTNKFNTCDGWSEIKINYLSCISNSKWNYKVRDG